MPLGKKPADIKKSVPKLEKLDETGLAKMKFDSKEPTVSPAEIHFDLAKTPDTTEGGLIITQHESEEMSKLAAAHDIQMGVKAVKAVAQVLRPIPDLQGALHFWGIGADIANLPGGTSCPPFRTL